MPSEGERGDHPDGWRTIRHFAYADRDFRAVRRLLAAKPEQPLTGPTAELHVRRAGFDVARDVRMVIGELRVGV
jgi:hypothetical protein